MAKLWQKGYELDSLIEEFTVGNDYVLDLKLTTADAVSSMAHATMLSSIDILSDDELDSLKSGLTAVIDSSLAGTFEIHREDEDCHTAIENYLINTVGEAGKKIHAGRSRNDQVTTALRVYNRAALFSCLDAGIRFAGGLADFAEEYEFVPMPGRTHMQIAMPSSVGLWAGAFLEETVDALEHLWRVYPLIDQCPLGAAAGYGVHLPLDRDMTARLLGFSKTQNNVLYAVGGSRGKIEAYFLDALDQLCLTLSRLAQDLILFSLPEFGYFSLPEQLCTGSSIMPQKKNPDALELMRAKAASVSMAAGKIKAILRALPSGYNRDIQETKEPFMSGTATSLNCLRIMDLTVRTMEVHEKTLKKAFKPEIYAADVALTRVSEGMSFRDAYREVAADLADLQERDPVEAIKNRKSVGTTGNLGLDIVRSRIDALRSTVSAEANRVEDAVTELVGRSVEIF